MAVTLSALLFLILGAIQFGIVFWNWNSMLLAVEEAGRYAMLYNPTNFPNGPPAAPIRWPTAPSRGPIRTWAAISPSPAQPVPQQRDDDLRGDPYVQFHHFV